MHTYFLLHADVRVSVVLVRHFKSLVVMLWMALISAPEIAFSNGHSRTWDHQFILNWYHQWEFYRDGHQRDSGRVDMENISVRSRNALHKKCSDKLLLFVDELKNLPEDKAGMRMFYSRLLDRYKYGLRVPANWGPFYDIYIRCEAVMGVDWSASFTTPIKQQIETGPDQRFPLPHFPYAGWKETVFCGRKTEDLGCAVP